MHHDIQLFAEYAVTPFVGVWIETTLLRKTYNYWLSHPSWVCGLKHNLETDQLFAYEVTPFVGVWIETPRYVELKSAYESHPSWVCGLKQKMLRMAEQIRESHPSWVCGLKLADTGKTLELVSHTLRGCVD